MSHEEKKALCESGLIPLERNRYFTGKYMTARDFASEQEYFLGRQRAHNRLLHGWGVVCGLNVIPHTSDDVDCKQNWIIVKAGAALDCYGREIYLPKDIPVEVPVDKLPTVEYPDAPPPVPSEGQWNDGQPGQPSDDSAYFDQSGFHVPDEPNDCFDGLLLVLKYEEEEIEPVPAIYAEGHCEPNHHEANRVREVIGIDFVLSSTVDSDCWHSKSGKCDTPVEECEDEIPAPAGACMEPHCPCNGAVPIALLVKSRNAQLPEPAPNLPLFNIDNSGRRRLPTPAHYLTHIKEINWPHGLEVPLHELRHEDAMNAELRITFDRKIRSAEGIATGVNRRTFSAEFGGMGGEMTILESDESNEARLSEDGLTAILPIDRRFIEGYKNISGSFVFITLRCDFISDCHDMPVDGNHTRGLLPSGNGTPGGDFVSWFRVVDRIGEEY